MPPAIHALAQGLASARRHVLLDGAPVPWVRVSGFQVAPGGLPIRSAANRLVPTVRARACARLSTYFTRSQSCPKVCPSTRRKKKTQRPLENCNVAQNLCKSFQNLLQDHFRGRFVAGQIASFILDPDTGHELRAEKPPCENFWLRSRFQSRSRDNGPEMPCRASQTTPSCLRASIFP